VIAELMELTAFVELKKTPELTEKFELPEKQDLTPRKRGFHPPQPTVI